MSGTFFQRCCLQVPRFILAGAFACALAAHPAHGQEIKLDAFAQLGTGVGWNPMRRTEETGLGGNYTAYQNQRLTLLGNWANRATRLQWIGRWNAESFAQDDIDSRQVFAGEVSLERRLNAAIVSGVDGSWLHGALLEQDIRAKEDWRLFQQSEWSGRWWMRMNDRNREREIYLHRGKVDYTSQQGYSRDEFAAGLQWCWLLHKRKRGRFRLDKIRQARTQPAGKLVFTAEHQQQNFSNWRRFDALLPSSDFMRADAISLRDDRTVSPSQWLITQCSFGYDLPVWRGVKSGVRLLWVNRNDAARLEFDAQRKGFDFWLHTEQPMWNLRLKGTLFNEVWSDQYVFTDAGWDMFAFRSFRFDGRAEFKLNMDWRIFAAMAWCDFSSDALPVGWRQRSDWTSGTVQVGIIWSCSNASKWDRKHKTQLQMCPASFDLEN